MWKYKTHPTPEKYIEMLEDTVKSFVKEITIHCKSIGNVAKKINLKKPGLKCPITQI